MPSRLALTIMIQVLIISHGMSWSRVLPDYSRRCRVVDLNRSVDVSLFGVSLSARAAPGWLDLPSRMAEQTRIELDMSKLNWMCLQWEDVPMKERGMQPLPPPGQLCTAPLRLLQSAAATRLLRPACY